MLTAIKYHTSRWIAFCILSLCSLAVFAASPVNTLEKSGFFSYEASGVAIRGADTVAYFTEKKYIPGTDQFTSQWQGATWKFSSQQHLDLFNKNPEKYAPQYGGYCAYGVAKGSLVKIEPENWKVVDGRLYLNYNNKFQKKWEEDVSGFIEAADTKFSELLAN